MVVNLNPAVSNRSQIAFCKSEKSPQKMYKGHYQPTKLSGHSPINLKTGIAILLATLGFTACGPEGTGIPVVKPPDTPTDTIKPPPTPVDDNAVAPYLKDFYHDVNGINTDSIKPENVGYNEVNVTPVDGAAYKSSWTVNDKLSSKDTVILDQVSENSTSKIEGLTKLFVTKDPSTGKKVLGAKYFLKKNGALSARYQGMYIKDGADYIEKTSENVTLKYSPKGKGVVDLSKAEKYFARIVNIVTRAK